jgi:hypothetical protein
MADEFDEFTSGNTSELKKLFSNGNYIAIFGFLQFVLRHETVPLHFAKRINSALVRARAAYRVFEERTIIPVGSDAEGTTLKRAFADLAASEFLGARRHLVTAGSELTAGNFASSVR